MTRTTRRVRLILLLAVTVVASGCGRKLMPTPTMYVGSDPSTFDMVPEERRSNVVEILYATDRLPADETTSKAPKAHRAPGLAYSAERSKSLAFGVTRVRLGPEDMTWAELAEASVTAKRDLPLKYIDVEEHVRTPMWPWYSNLAADPDVTPEQNNAAIDEAVAQLCEMLTERLAESDKKEVYVFVHGFNNTFEHAAESLAELWHFMGRPGVAMLYSWPAGLAGVFGYAADYESSEFTVGHFKLTLRAIASCDAVERVHVLSHSRGAGVLGSGLRELEIEYRNRGDNTAAELKLGNAVFAAADLDLEVTNQRVGAEKAWDACDRITVYAEAGDKALGFAGRMFKGSERLGEMGPKVIKPYQTAFFKHFEDKISIVYNAEKASLIGHAYYVDNPMVSSDLIMLLRDNASPGSVERPLKRDASGLWLIEPGYPHVTPESE